MMMQRFEGKTVIVTGAASGIGRATASLFAREGARVVAVDRASEGLETLAAEFGGASIETILADLCDASAATAVARCAGEVDVLANVAGIMDSFLPAGEVDDDTWDRVIAVNLTAPLRLMRAVLPGMVARRTGAIVNVASVAGLKGGCAGAAYTASKHGLIGLTRNTAFLYAAKGVRANVVAPGAVETGIESESRSALADERIPALLKASITHFAQTKEIAASIAWLASSDSANVNGTVLASDDGWSAA